MPRTFTDYALPTFQRGLRNLSHILSKAEANARARKFEPDVFVSLRLAPDMLTFASQVRIACDAAKLCMARIGGLEAPRFEDNETTLAQLQERVARTLAWLETLPVDALEGREDLLVTFPVGRDATRSLSGADYLRQWALPNFYFHITTAYALLRHNGVDLGKRDYLMGPEALG